MSAQGNVAAKAEGDRQAIRHAIRREAGLLTWRRSDPKPARRPLLSTCAGCGMGSGAFGTRRAFTDHRALCEAG